MSSFARAKPAVALLLAATLTSAVAIPMIESNPATTFAVVDTTSTGTSAMTTAPAVWLQTESTTNVLTARQEDDSVSIKTYCTSEEPRRGHYENHCEVLTHPVGTRTRTITEYPALPTASEGRCGFAHEFDDLTGPDSPLAEDCIELAHRIRGAGEWTVEGFLLQDHQLVEWKTCAFGIMSIQATMLFLVGNQDIIDLLRDSVRDFTLDGRVGAMGKMWCRNNPGWSVQVKWGIYRNGLL
jgi:hypothetical protein